jgi:hypothetical protein
MNHRVCKVWTKLVQISSSSKLVSVVVCRQFGTRVHKLLDPVRVHYSFGRPVQARCRRTISLVILVRKLFRKELCSGYGSIREFQERQSESSTFC